MAQVNYRALLAAKAFPFISTQFGQSVIISSADQVGAAQTTGESAVSNANTAQAYYMHNVLPTSQGYRSIGYKQLIPAVEDNVEFDRIIPIRDPDKTQGFLGITKNKKIYIYQEGDNRWLEASIPLFGWTNGEVSVAYVNGYTYICFSGFKVCRVDVASRTLYDVDLTGVVEDKIAAITGSMGYLIITDGVTIYWSSTITPEDFIPSLVTGAGSGKPQGAEGNIVALAATESGFICYTSSNAVVALYSQNPRYPWIFKGIQNAKGIMNSQYLAAGGEDSSYYAWTAAGLQRIATTGSLTVMAEVTDFLAGQEFEDYDAFLNAPRITYLSEPMKIKLAYVGARFLVISYGIKELTHALVYDNTLKRWGKLKFTHAACFELYLNSDLTRLSGKAASAKTTLGFVTPKGEIHICNFAVTTPTADSVLLLGKYQLTRSRLCTMDEINVETVGTNNNAFTAYLLTSLNGATLHTTTKLTAKEISEGYRCYPSRVTGMNHSLLFKGNFSLTSLELSMHVNGRR